MCNRNEIRGILEKFLKLSLYSQSGISSSKKGTKLLDFKNNH